MKLVHSTHGLETKGTAALIFSRRGEEDTIELITWDLPAKTRPTAFLPWVSLSAYVMPHDLPNQAINSHQPNREDVKIHFQFSLFFVSKNVEIVPHLFMGESRARLRVFLLTWALSANASHNSDSLSNKTFKSPTLVRVFIRGNFCIEGPPASSLMGHDQCISDRSRSTQYQIFGRRYRDCVSVDGGR